MSYVYNGDIRLHYCVEGSGPPLVLHHGLMGSGQSWSDFGYVDGLKNEFQLILLDARGHGKSDKSHDPEAYRAEFRVGDVVAVLDDIGIDRAHFFGYSYGGGVGFLLAKFAPERMRSLIIGGAGPKGLDPQEPNPLRELFAAGSEAVLAKVSQFGPVSDGMKTQVLASDMEALVAILNCPRLSVVDDLADMTLPFLLYVGSNDEMNATPAEIEACAGALPRAEFVLLPGLNHTRAIERSDLVLPHVRKFLRATAAGVL